MVHTIGPRYQVLCTELVKFVVSIEAWSVLTGKEENFQVRFLGLTPRFDAIL